MKYLFAKSWNVLSFIFYSLWIVSAFLVSMFPAQADVPPADECAQRKFGCFEAQFPGLDNRFIDVVAEGGVVGYVGAIMTIVTGLIIVVSLIAIVVAGYIYMTAGGDASRITTSKTIMSSALLGIVLAIAAVLILRTINPDLVPTTDPF